MEGTYEERKLSILKAAARVISRQGFHKFTFRQVAAEANISPGTLYYYYNSKNLIIYDILDYSQSDNEKLARVMENGDITLEDVKARLMENLINHLRDINGSKIFLHLLHESLSEDAELAERLKQKYNAWLISFEKVIELHYGIPRGPENRGVAILVNAVMDGLSWMELMGVDTSNNPAVQWFFERLINGEFEKIISKLRKEQTVKSVYSRGQILQSDS